MDGVTNASSAFLFQISSDETLLCCSHIVIQAGEINIVLVRKILLLPALNRNHKLEAHSLSRGHTIRAKTPGPILSPLVHSREFGIRRCRRPLHLQPIAPDCRCADPSDVPGSAVPLNSCFHGPSGCRGYSGLRGRVSACSEG